VEGVPLLLRQPRALLRLDGDDPSPLASPVDPSERTEDDPGAPDGGIALLGSPLGAGNGVRLSEAAWLAHDGWLGHEHVPGGNVHGDPGLFPWARLVTLSGNKPKPPKPLPLTVDGVLGVDTIRRWQTVLNALGAKPKLAADGKLGPATWAAVQRWLGHTPANGVPGRDTIRDLERHLGVTVDGTLGRDTVRALQRWLNAQPAK
jgi:hypothetical protein